MDSSPLVGRDDLLRVLKAHVSAPDPERRVLSLIGESGIGKSSLLDACSAAALADGMWVLRGEADSSRTRLPLSLFNGFGRGLADLARDDQRLRQGLRALGYLDGRLEAWLFDEANTRSGRPAFRHSRAARPLSSVVDLLRVACDAKGPGLLLLDDCHLGDSTSLQTLASLTHSLTADKHALPLSVVSTFETDLDQARLWPARAMQHLIVPPLDRASVIELLRRHGDQPQPELVDYVLEYSAGNPFEVGNIVISLLRSGQISNDGGSLSFCVHTNSAFPQLPRGLRAHGWKPDHSRSGAFLSQRLARLEPATRMALRRAAVLGMTFSSAQLARVVVDDGCDVEAALQEACTHGFLRAIAAPSGCYRFTHERLHSGILSASSAEDLRCDHGLVATALMTGGAENCFKVSHHLRRAGRCGAAVPFALQAGEIALDVGCLEMAEEHYTTAIIGLEDGRGAPESCFRAHEGLGVVHMLRGHYGLSEQQLLKAWGVAATVGRLAVARVSIDLEELAFKSGRLEETTQWRIEAAGALGIYFPDERQTARWALLRELGWLLISFLPRPTSRRGTPGEERYYAARLYNRQAYTWFFTGTRHWALWSLLRARRFARAAPHRGEYAQSLSSLAAFIAVFAPVARWLALRLIGRAVELRRAPGSTWGRAQSLHFLGLTLNALGSYEDAISAFEDAWEAFESVGDRWESNAGQWQKAICLFRLGRLREAAEVARWTFEAASKIGDRISAGSALAVWARCRPAEVTMGMIDAQLERTIDVHTQVLLMSARGWLLIHEEDYQQAASVLTEVQNLCRRRRVTGAFIVSMELWKLHALRLELERTPDWQLELRRRQRREVRRQLRRCLRRSAVHPAQRAELLRSLALWFSTQGRRRTAQVVLRMAARQAGKTHAEGELAACAYLAGYVNKRSTRRPPPVVPITPYLEDEITVSRGFMELARPASGPAQPGGWPPVAVPELVQIPLQLMSAGSVDRVLHELEDLTARLLPGVRQKIRPLAGSAAPTDDQDEETQPEVRSDDTVATDRLMRMRLYTSGAPCFEHELALQDGHAAELVRPTAVMLARLASAALTRLQLDNTKRQRLVAVQEAERRRVAVDLHDEFGSKFSAIIAEASALASQISPPSQRRAADDIQAIARDGVLSIREVAWVLRPVGLDDLGLVRCLEQLVEHFQRRNRLAVEFMSSGTPDDFEPDPEVQIALYRVVQEALTNVGRHSGAQSASVFLSRSDNRLRIIVEDDGMGFIVEEQKNSFGLFGMRERMQLVGGSLVAESELGHGTTIVAELSLPR